MGFYSFKCKACQESIKAPYELPESMAWQNEVVVVTDEDTMHTGAYDGYGRVNKADSTFERVTEEHGVWHRQCFDDDCTLEGANYLLIDYSDLASVSAPDQGYWYDRPEGDERLNRPLQGTKAWQTGVVDTRLLHENEAAATFE
tara:strand:+ start:1245 stop:1676 length:432 start_codon:yes stop_codon:yes gene_type:complete